METTKFTELCKAYGKAQSDFKQFQEDCYQLTLKLVKELKEYFQIPESQFSLFKIDANNEFHLVQPAVINALNLRPDSLWQFGIGLTMCTSVEASPQELILIQILIRKDLEGCFFLKYGNEDKEHKVEKKEKFDFIPFFDYLHDTIINTYEQQITHFIGNDTRRIIGY